jgi:catechol 2,3-dioxygenase-like lactoylglutathione lyase family enzyme
LRWTWERPLGTLPVMTALLSHVTVDSRDAHAQSLFWAAVLGWAEDPDDPNEPGDAECMLFSPDGHQRLLFIDVPDAKVGKNRLHLDLRPASGTRDAELLRLLELGAVVVEDRRRPGGGGWFVLADPEGNEFCLLRGEAERAAVR